jgi:hypothetical protein
MSDFYTFTIQITVINKVVVDQYSCGGASVYGTYYEIYHNAKHPHTIHPGRYAL